MKLSLVVVVLLMGAPALAEMCQAFSLSAGSNQGTLIGQLPIGGRSNSGSLPGGFTYNIASLPEADVIYLKSADRIVEASGSVKADSNPLSVQSTDSDGNGVKIVCTP